MEVCACDHPLKHDTLPPTQPTHDASMRDFFYFSAAQVTALAREQAVLQAFGDKLNAIAQPMRQSMTCDQRSRVGNACQVATVDRDCGLLVRPTPPVAEGGNENMNGLERQYLPKGTDLSGHSQEQLDAIADEINGRPRKVLGLRSPLAVYPELLRNSSQPSPLIH